MAKLVGSLAQPAGAAGTAPNRPTRRQSHTLVISVSHGDLRQAKFPLAIGHYHGDSIVHAEERLDRQLDRRLTELFDLYLYPGPEGTTEVIHVPGASPPGALVIGLGNVGEIKPSIVRDGISKAALRHALAALNESRVTARVRAFTAPAEGDGAAAGPEMVGLSTLLLGTYGGNALSIGISLSSIIQGVVQANEALRSQGLWDKVRIGVLEVVELYEDVALEAMRAAVYLSENPPTYLVEGDSLQVEPLHMHPLGHGRTQRPIDPYARGWWRRIQITAEGGKDGQRGLRFLALTDRARAEDTLQYTQPKLIEKAVKEAVDESRDADMMTSMLFKLLFPNTLKEQAISDTDLVLVVDEKTAQYPWELLAERKRGAVEPLAVRMGMLRQFRTSHFVLNPQPARERSAFVVGAPKTPPGWAELDGAASEAELVAGLLEADRYDLGGGALIQESALKIMGRLMNGSYKIIHLAGHGKFTPDEPSESGMILDEGILLSSMELANLDPLPELVFINCCYLGRVGAGGEKAPPESPNELAASVARLLIEKGVKAVVAAGWPVYDEPAKVFAKTFYQEMLRGQKFGEAVKAARATTYKLHRDRNTWGAYQCYGNPDFVLERMGDGSESVRRQTRCFSRREYLEKLGDLKGDAARADEGERAALRAQLEQIDTAIPPFWRDGAMLRAIGNVWAELGLFDEAIANYRQAAKDEKAEAPLNTIEQLANMLSRHADDLRVQQADAAPQTRVLMNEAFERLNWLINLGETVERLSLMGSYYKRKAAAAPPKSAARLKHLQQAAAFYGRAHRLNKKNLKVVDPYPTLNWLTNCFLVGKPVNGSARLVEECKSAARQMEQKEPSFWNRATEADAELLKQLLNGELEDNVEAVAAHYRRAIGTGATQREISSVVHHLAFLEEMLSGARRPGSAGEKNVRALAWLRSQLSPTL